MNKRKIKNKLKKFLWKKLNEREYTYTYEDMERFKNDLNEFFKELGIESHIEIPLDDIEVNKRTHELFLKGRTVDVFIKYITKPKITITGFGPLL